MRELTPEENARINRQLRGERGEPLSQSEIDRINRQLRGEIANYAEEPEEEQTIESVIRQILIDHSIENLSEDIFVNLDGCLRNESGNPLNVDFERNLMGWHEIDDDVLIYAFFYNLVHTKDDQNYIYTMCILEDGMSFYAFNDTNEEEPAKWYVPWVDIKEVISVAAATLSDDPNGYIIANDPTFEICNTCDSQRLYFQDNTYITIPCFYFASYELTDFLNELVSKCVVFFQEEDSYQEDIEVSYNQSLSQDNSSEIEIIRQVLTDYSIGSLSDGIFVNIDGYLRNKSGEYLNEDYEKNLRDWHEIGDIPIYAFFYYSVQSQDDQDYIFTSCILGVGIFFLAFNNSNSNEAVCSWGVTWEDIRNITFLEDAKPNDIPNVFTLENDPTFIIYSSSISEVFHLCSDVDVYIPSTFFGNYILTNFLNDLVSKCKGLSYQKNNSLQSNDTYQNTYQQERYTNHNNNPSENKKRQDIGALSMDDQFFLDYLRDNPNTTIDESTVSIYNISIERANQLKEHFFK